MTSQRGCVERAGPMDLLSIIALAIAEDRPALVMAVLSQPDFDVNLAGSDGLTPLMMAVKSGLSDMVEILLMGGASVRIADRDGKTPLMLAEKARLATIADLLRERGAKA